MRRRNRLIGPPALTRRSLLAGMGATLGGALARRALDDGGPVAESPGPLLYDPFDGPDLDGTLWEPTAHNDFESHIADVVGGRLRLACSTIGTDDTTVKYHGIRSVEPMVPITDGAVVEFLFDWNDQANGCYMHAGVYIAPEASDNPADVDDRLEFVYIGVPPGQMARAWVTLRQGGLQPRILLDEGWPRDRTGRRIGVHSVSLLIERDRLTLQEDGEALLTAGDLDLDWGWSHLYLQQSSHSNYPLRTVYFDDVRVSHHGEVREE